MIGFGSVEPAESARVPATATIDGTTRTYEFQFSYRTRQPYDDCWVVENFGPA